MKTYTQKQATLIYLFGILFGIICGILIGMFVIGK